MCADLRVYNAPISQVVQSCCSKTEVGCILNYKMPRGRPKNVKPENIEIFRQFSDELVQNGILAKSTSQIFTDLGKKLKKTAKAVYLIVKRDFSEIFPDCDLQSNISYKEDDENSIDDKSINISQSENSLSFHIDIDPTVFPCESYLKKNRNQEYVRTRVKAGWADKLFDIIWHAKKLYCPTTIKSSYVDVNNSILFRGICNECEAVFECRTNCNHSLLTVDITNFKAEYVHSKRRHLKGSARENVVAKLKDNSAYKVHRQLAQELIEDGDTRVPAQLPKVTTLKNAKYKASVADGRNEIENILEWKNSNVEYRNSIFDVSISPFFVSYHLPIQREFYLAESRNNKMAISADATGGLIKPPLNSEISPSNQKLKHVFLYAGMLKTNGASIPIFQTISQKHSARFISYWLGEFFHKLPAMRPPSEVVCDDSKAFLLAFVKTFTIYHSVKEYIRACIKSLEHGSPPPGCYIRLDRSHFVKNLVRKIANKDERKRDFYRSIFGYLIQCENYQQAKIIIQDLFTVVLNKFAGKNYAGELPAEKSMNRLLDLCATHEFNFEVDGEDPTNYLEEVQESEEEIQEQPDDAWLQEIISKVPITNDVSKKSTGNIYYCEYDKNKFVKLMSTLPLWSNIMNEIFDSQFTTATSQDVESYFKTLKHHILDQKMIRSDKFLSSHISSLKTEYKLRMAEGMTARKIERPHPKEINEGILFIEVNILSIMSIRIYQFFVHNPHVFSSIFDSDIKSIDLFEHYRFI